MNSPTCPLSRSSFLSTKYVSGSVACLQNERGMKEGWRFPEVGYLSEKEVRKKCHVNLQPLTVDDNLSETGGSSQHNQIRLSRVN